MATKDDFIGNLRDAILKQASQAAEEEERRKDERVRKSAETGDRKIMKKEAERSKESAAANKNFVKNLRSILSDRNLEKLANDEANTQERARVELRNNVKEQAAKIKQSFEDTVHKLADTLGKGLRGEDISGEIEVKESQPEQMVAQQSQQVQEPQYSAEDFVSYTYKPGDTFGRVLMKMGLSDGRNLWGPGGDVEYYTKQLNDQGIYGNIPIGRTINLRRRK